MRKHLLLALVGFLGVAISCLPASLLPASAQAGGSAEAPASAVPQLTATTLRTWPNVPEADQGVAAERRVFHAVDNHTLATYDRISGERLRVWEGGEDGPIQHMNSCYARQGRLWCANSNYPEVPHGSSVEVFDAASLRHVQTHSLGLMDEGSLVWFDVVRGGWLGGFAHYATRGGTGFKGPDYASVITMDAQWRRTGGWLFPAALVARFSPHAASGGAIGPCGWLYAMGHDAPEMYVLGQPLMGPHLVHIATITLEAAGQAFSFAPDAPNTAFVVERRAGQVRQIALPAISCTHPTARPFAR
jgi:hypothetical protein